MYKYLIALVALIVLFDSVSNSQVNKRIFFTAGGGISAPLEKEGFPVNYGIGYNFDLKFGQAFHNNISWCVEGTYSFFNNPTVRGDQLPEKPTFSITGVTANLLTGSFNKNSDFHHYTLVGAGIHFVSSTDSSGVKLSESETSFGLSIGAGISLLTYSSIGFFTQIRYDLIFSKNTVKSNIPFVIGFMYSPK
jgi:opacity protein-like surface antigen